MQQNVVAYPWRGDGPDDCPVADVIERLSGKWKPRLLHILSVQEMHFLELCRVLPQASRKMLAIQLRELTTDGLISRDELNDARRRVRYSLTSRGRELCTVLDSVRTWAIEPGDGAC